MRRLRSFVPFVPSAASLAALGLVSLVVACGGEVEVEVPGAAPSATKPEAQAASKVSEVVQGLLRAGEPQEVLVVYDGATIEARARADQGLPPASDRRSEREARRAFLHTALEQAKAAVHAHLDAAHVRVVRDYDELPVSVVRVDSLSAALALAAHDDVVQIHENFVHEAFADENLTIINQPAAVQAGFDGAGATIAMIDTGLDYTRPEFGSCQSAGADGCRVLFVGEVAPEDYVLDDPNLPHGTATSATAAMVAPGAKLVGLDVFTGGGAYDADLLTAINWTIQNRDVYGIEAINMSLGGGKFTKECPGYAVTEALKAARNVGILSAVASGNNGYIDSLAYPSCGPAAISVGATTDMPMVLNNKAVAADTVTYYSNSSPLLKILAPGSVVNVTGSGWHGTSFAAPHVAAAIATLAAAYPEDSPDQLQSRLLVTGKAITDTRNKVTTPRLDLQGATQPCVYDLATLSASVVAEGGTANFKLTTSNDCPWTAESAVPWLTPSATSGTGPVTLTLAASLNNTTLARKGTVAFAGKTLTVSQDKDIVPPVGTLVANYGALLSKSTTVHLDITGSDINGVPQMCVSNASTCSAWLPFATSLDWKLTVGDGKKTVYLLLKDGVGNISKAVTAPVTVDTVGPTGGVVKAGVADGALNLTWSGFADALSGVASFKVYSAEGTKAPVDCKTGTPIWTGKELAFAHTGLTNGTTYSYRVCPVDGNGNVGVGATVTGKPLPFTDPPVGSVSLNLGAISTPKQIVSLHVDATSKGTVKEMCVSNAATCATWIPFVATMDWTLSAANGTKTVNVWLRDEWGNTTAKPLSDTIVWDNIGPTGGLVKAAVLDGALKLTWSGFVDAYSGVASYAILAAEGSTPPASCTSGAPIWTGKDLTYTHAGLTNGTTYSYRVCPVDGNGNIGAGATVTGKPLPFTDPPTGSVVINGGALYTVPQLINLQIAATSKGTVKEMCVSNVATCSSWIPFTETMAWTLSTGNGTKAVYVWFRDEWGNTTAKPVSDTIVWDNVAPTAGAITVTAVAGQFTVAWSGMTDATSGIDSYTLVAADGLVAPASCAAGAVVYTGQLKTFVQTGVPASTARSFRVCTTDKVGNTSAGVAKTATTPAAP